jgi:GTPase SAR1 family protein
MGNYLSSICFVKRKPCKVLIHGLDAAGKTTILYKVKLPEQEMITTIPTIGEQYNHQQRSLMSPFSRVFLTLLFYFSFDRI